MEFDENTFSPPAERNLEELREESRLKILNRFALHLIGIPSETDLFWYVAREVVGKLGFVDCVIYLADPERNLLRQVAAIGEKNPTANAIVNILEIPIGQGITGQVAKTREAIIVDDLSRDSRYIPDLVEARSEICVPLIVDDELIGVIDSEDPRPHRFGPEDLEVLNTVAAMTGAKLSLLRKDRALRESERDFRALFDTTTCGIGRTLLEDGRVILANAKLAEMFGYDSPEAFKAEFVFADHYVDPNDRQRLLASYNDSPGKPTECAFKRKDGSTVTVQAYAQANYELGILNFVAIDISQQVEMAAELRMNEALVQALIEHSPVALSIKDLDGRYTFVSPTYSRYLGVEAEETKGRPAEQFVSPETSKALKKGDAEVLRTKAPLQHDKAFHVEFGGSTLLVTKFPILDPDGKVMSIGTVGIDITDHKAAEILLRESERRLKEAQRIAVLGGWEMTDAGELYWSDETYRIFGIERDGSEGATDPSYNHVHPDDRELVREAAAGAWSSGQPYDCVHRIVRPSGEIRTVRERAEFIPDPRGDTIVLSGTVQDITEMVAIEEQLRQAQKMEVVGQLTGGVAHDFNNLLAVIQGNAELIAGDAGHDNAQMEAIIRASKRGAELTHRLLAFSRQQPLQPKPTDLVALVQSMTEMLKRTLGATIEIETIARGGLAQVLVDPGQLENALLNLAVNASHAMPQGGKLTIQSENARLDEAYVANNPEATVGDYVVLAVSDTGTGMSAAVQARAFEPFFTTKEVGEGSGLGLSMVYGFAKQSGGQVTIYSEVDQGTTVKVYLPRAEGEAPAVEADGSGDTPQGRGETILVIEDDQDLRVLAVEMLESLGYQTIGMPDALSASETLANGTMPDLVLSDIVLPGGISGPEFAETTSEAYPDLKIVFMSGYPAEAANRNGFLGSNKVLLNKPFQMTQLATALREALD